MLRLCILEYNNTPYLMKQTLQLHKTKILRGNSDGKRFTGKKVGHSRPKFL